MYNTIQSVDYFIYNGIAYAKGTEIELTDDVYVKYGIELSKNTNVIFISQNNTCLYCLIKGLSVIMVPNDTKYIKSIIRPIYYEKPSAINSAINNFVMENKSPDVFNGVLWYILIMIFLLICKHGFLFMIFVTIIFAGWLINKYKD